MSVAEQRLTLVTLGGLKNPYLSPTEARRFNKAYLGWRGTTLARRLDGEPYQIHGHCTRGEGAPTVVMPRRVR